jgi:hypothetical protein
MIAWNGVEKMLQRSNDIVMPLMQDSIFFHELKPVGKCELGKDIANELKMLKIKN